MATAIVASGSFSIAQTAAIDPPPVDDLSGGTRPEQLLLFGGFDLWRNSLAGYGGLQWAASDLNSDGFIVRLLIADSAERYRTPTTTFTTNIFRASLLPGWRFKRGEFEIKLFAGLDLEHQKPMPDVVGARPRGMTPGLRVAAETWLEPVPEIMLATSFYVTTIGSGYGARGAAGWRLCDRFWIGPELSGSADEFSRQTKVGVHLTGLRIAELEWSVAAGYLNDSYHRSGLYARIGVLTRQ
ncbi:cellulose biosynthesis protein BcsS [Rhodopseudomonas sp.]|uniref:cellulose biosynthesis protein BcsS n=1 Tax=Rhodopseudomonas sp. TaxID=1078 RepID=UPI0025D5E911|nr:cellulose biosynthesis protein BcsS [Rhodopseudomonas sp.]